MAEKKKSIIEEALLEAKSIEDALKANTKEILASTMKEEIDNVVRESLQEEEVEDNEELEGLDDLTTDDEFADDESVEDSADLVLDLDVEPNADDGEEPVDVLDLDDEPKTDDAEFALPDDLEGDEMETMDIEMGELGAEEELDLRMAPDEEVLKVFKLMSDEDEVEVVKDEDGIHISDRETGAEYYIKESDEEMTTEGQFCEGCGYSESEAIYEVELDEDMYEAYMESKEIDEVEGEEVEESTRRTRADRRRRDHKPSNYPTNESRRSRKPIMKESRRTRKPLTESRNDVRKESYEKLLREYKELKAKNGEYKEALKVFKTKINEVALFNQNLAHVTKLFTEHSTTKKEKMSILGRFDSVETIKESKSLYKTLEAELSEKTPINESVEKKVNKTVETSKSNLNESTAYVDPQINAIKDLMRRIS